MPRFWEAIRKFAAQDFLLQIVLVLALAVAGAVAYCVDR